MSKYDIAGTLLDRLKEARRVSYTNTAGTELITRCPYCGDSRKNQRHGHFYIKLSESFPFYCQRCQTSGVLTPEVLRDLSIFDTKLAAEVQMNNKFYRNLPRKKGSVSFPTRDLEIPEPLGSKVEQRKLDYLNSRLGTNITPEEAVSKFRCILDIKDFFLYNEIDVVIADDLLKQFRNYGLGFLSHDQSTIIFRSINTKKTRWRYYSYNIFGEEDIKRFYTIQTNIDILSPTVGVSIAEGIFDILGVYLNVYQGDPGNRIFVAVNGKGYNLVFNYLARLGFLDMDIEIYSDEEVGLGFYKRIKESSPVLKDSRIKVFYNRLAKDCGVPADQIDLKYSFI